MKKFTYIKLTVLLLFTGIASYSQHSFAPVGAEWWYANTIVDYWSPAVVNNVIQVRSVADTIVDGVACRKVVTSSQSVTHGTPPDLFYPINRTYYFYDNTDTVFIYNENFSRFTPLYVFNVPDGDTVCLPVPPTPSGAADLRFNPISGDTSFCFVVDSVRLRLYDNVPLRTVFTRTLYAAYGAELEPTAYPAYNWGNASMTEPNTGQYTERIAGNFLPYRLHNCADCHAVTYAPSGTLRCYTDSLYTIRLSADPCDTLYPLHITAPQSAAHILNVYPNPASDELNIALHQSLTEDLSLSVIDLSGRIIFQASLPKGSYQKRIRIKDWAEGLYLLRFRTAAQVYYSKVMVQRSMGQ